MHRVLECRFSPAVVVLTIVLLTGGSLRAGVVINEIMYNPTGGGEYIELHNAGAEVVDLEGWSLAGAVDFTAAPGASLAPGAFTVVVGDAGVFTESYPGVRAGAVLGEFSGALDNDGELLLLSDAEGNVVESLPYGDNAPWEFLADGFGASLERLCADAEAGLYVVRRLLAAHLTTPS